MSAVIVEKIRAHVPEQLRAAPVWLLHDARKVPYYVQGARRHGVLDSPEDRALLVTFERAAAALRRSRQACGLGIALGRVDDETIICGIDLDHCIDEHDMLDPRVVQIMGAACSYSERSPSGRGVHVLGLGPLETTKTPGLEIYSGQRYFTVTGAALNRAGLADLTEAAVLARRLYQVRCEVARPWLAPVVPITPALVERAQQKFEALIETFRTMRMYRGQRGAWHDVVCPWVERHTGGEISGSALSEPSARNGWMGGYRCHHAHCSALGMRDIRAWCRELVKIIDERKAS